jgi:hypothetical protein
VLQVGLQPGRWRWLLWTGVDNLGRRRRDRRLAGDDGGEGRERRHGQHGAVAAVCRLLLHAAGGCCSREDGLASMVARRQWRRLHAVVGVAVVEGGAATRVREGMPGWVLLEAEAGRVHRHGQVVGALHHHQLAILVACLVQYPADDPFLLHACMYVHEKIQQIISQGRVEV